jgi:flavin-dependent dehydrogenase
MTYDVAIVGGGPVGLAAAIEARMAGLSVVLIEQRAGTIDKACGEGLMPGALPLLDRLGVHPEGQPLHGVTYRQGAASVTHRFAGGGGLGVRRLALHDALAGRAAELGVERMTAKVGGVIQDAAGVSIAIGGDGSRDGTGDGTGTGAITARYLLACDGLHSSVARAVGLALPPRRSRRRYGTRQHYAIAPWSDTIEVYYGANTELYVTPLSPSLIGLAMLGPRGADFDRAVSAQPDLADRLRGIPLASSRRGAGPFAQRTRARVAGRVLLVGDASGYVDAITGEGLRLGFAQAREAIAAVIADSPGDYEEAWRRTTRDFRVLTTGLVLAAQSPLRRGIVPLATRLPGLFGTVVERLAR